MQKIVGSVSVISIRFARRDRQNYYFEQSCYFGLWDTVVLDLGDTSALQGLEKRQTELFLLFWRSEEQRHIESCENHIDGGDVVDRSGWSFADEKTLCCAEKC